MKPHRTFKIILLSVAFSGMVMAGNLDDLLQKAENARKSFRDLEAIRYYRQILQIDSNHFQALWNTSFLYQHAGWLETQMETKKQLYASAIEYARKLYSKYPGTYEANIVMGGGIARMTEFLPAKEKVEAAWDIKKYGDAAMKLNPSDHQVWYLLGWLNFEMSKASWMERSLASLLFGGLPKGSLEEGIQYLEKANALNPDCIVYLYDLATFYERKDTSTAIQLTKKALAISPVTPEDFIYRDKCQRLLTRLNS